MLNSERIQKFLANSGLGARREIEEWIKQGRIHVNGKLAKLGDRISTGDKVNIDGKPVRLVHNDDIDLKIIAYYKPAGIVCSHKDKEGRITVFDKLPPPEKGRWVNIGRLDINTIGLILFTNNGTLANRLMHPSGNIEREYAVRVLGTATEQQLKNLQQGVELDDGLAAFNSIVDKGGEGVNHWYHIVINEGRNREVRRLWESQGLKVSRLIRVRYGPYQLPRNKRVGMHWMLSGFEIETLLQAVGMQSLLAEAKRESRSSTPASKAGGRPDIRSKRNPAYISRFKPGAKEEKTSENKRGNKTGSRTGPRPGARPRGKAGK